MGNSRKSFFDYALRGSSYFPMKRFIIAQSKVETANYTSPLYKRNSNLFGMKNAIFRRQLGDRVEGDDYRKYADGEESVFDLILYFDYTVFPIVLDSTSYVMELKRRGYFTSDENDYLKALNSWL